MNDYNDYVLLEWEKFVSDPSRARASLDATARMDIKRVLDVGCGAGQELLPFVRDGGALGVGIDIAPTVGHVVREKLAAHAPEARVHFLRGSAEDLSFPDGVFDAVICRLALPYTNNARALAEASRVLRPGGRYLLKIHGVRWYLDLLKRGLKSRNLMSMIYASRVLVAGSIYHLSRRQPRTRIPSTETFQSEWLLRRELRRHGLAIQGKTPDSNPLTPSFVIVKSD
ncbi:MAG: class I SAM-dependent methyltransferase [Acidobacteriota bacterium]|nr:class I SAM-dependent methyltransferase [Acidobacteriota bacterium]